MDVVPAEDEEGAEADVSHGDPSSLHQPSRPRPGRPRKPSGSLDSSRMTTSSSISHAGRTTTTTTTTTRTTRAAEVDGRAAHEDEEVEVEVGGAARRRVRGPSKRPCQNKNAQMARENRQRKKAYVERIESRLGAYQREAEQLARGMKRQAEEIKRLRAEVVYLRSVMRNNGVITELLEAMNEGLRRRRMTTTTTTKGGDEREDCGDEGEEHRRWNGEENGGGRGMKQDVLNWVVSGQQTPASTRIVQPTSAPITGALSEVYKEDLAKIAASSSPSRIARKTLPYTQRLKAEADDDPPPPLSIEDSSPPETNTGAAYSALMDKNAAAAIMDDLEPILDFYSIYSS